MEDKSIKFLSANPDLCLGCRSCELACAGGKFSRITTNTKNKKNNRKVASSIIVTQVSDKKVPAICRHCDNAYCLELCPANAISRVQGVVIINDDKCTGCGICEQGCPYGVITMTSYTENGKEKSIANKCDLCIDRQVKDKNPLCYIACPTKAIGLVSK